MTSATFEKRATFEYMAAIPILDLAEKLFPSRKQYVSVREVVEETSLSERHVRRLVADGQLETSKVGRRILVLRSSLDSLLNR